MFVYHFLLPLIQNFDNPSLLATPGKDISAAAYGCGFPGKNLYRISAISLTVWVSLSDGDIGFLDLGGQLLIIWIPDMVQLLQKINKIELELHT